MKLCKNVTSKKLKMKKKNIKKTEKNKFMT